MQSALTLRLPMPGEELGQDAGQEYEDDDGWDTAEWEDEELPNPMSEDEQVNGAFPPPPRDYSEVANRKPRRRHRRPPMPRTPNPEHDPNAWVAPFEVLEDGTVVGPTLGDGDPTRLPDGFEPEKGSFEGVVRMFVPPGSGGEGMPR